VGGDVLVRDLTDGTVVENWLWSAKEGKNVNLDPRVLGQDIAGAGWCADSRRILLGGDGAPIKQVHDVQASRREAVYVPTIAGYQWAIISPDGHCRGSSRIDEYLVYVVLTDDGRQETYTPAAFAAKFGWKNDPSKVTLTPVE
jgi:hypothetical protein